MTPTRHAERESPRERIDQPGETGTGDVTKRKVEDTPDAVLSSENGVAWHVTCTLCVRTLGRASHDRPTALWRAREHLATVHALRRIYVEVERPGYQRAVSVALPLVVAHDRTLPSDWHNR